MYTAPIASLDTEVILYIFNNSTQYKPCFVGGQSMDIQESLWILYGYMHGYSRKSVDMDTDMDGKFHSHTHGNPGKHTFSWHHVTVNKRDRQH